MILPIFRETARRNALHAHSEMLKMEARIAMQRSRPNRERALALIEECSGGEASIRITGEITDKYADEIVEQLKRGGVARTSINLKIVDCPGGSMPACQRIVAALRADHPFIEATARGRVASAGVLILMAGHRRAAAQSATLGLHSIGFELNARDEVYANSFRLRELANIADRLSADLLKSIGKKAKLTQNDERWIRSGRMLWLSATEAAARNVVHHFVA